MEHTSIEWEVDLHARILEVVARIDFGVCFGLVAGRIEVLTAVALTVQQADADQVDGRVCGRLDVVSCQDTQAA